MATETPPPRQWRLLIALFAALVLILGAVYFAFLRQDYAVLYQDLREDDAAAVTRTLEAQRVHYRLANGGADILVPAGDIDQIRLDIAASDVAINGLEGFELFDQSDMGLTDFAQRIRYQRALQGELARTIMRMDGVVDARVHLSIPERTLFRADRRNAEAAVTVVTRRAQDMTSARVEGIRRLVAAAVNDLSPDDVVVLDGRGQSLVAESEYTTEIPSDPAGEIEALARQAVHRAIPYRRFELRGEPIPATLDGAPTGEEGLAPALALTIATEASLTLDERERVQVELTRAGLAAEAGQITFDVGPLRPPPRPMARNAPEVQASAETGASSPATTNWLGLGGVLLALIVAALMGWRFLQPSLSPDERRSFASQLENALDSDKEAASDAV